MASIRHEILIAAEADHVWDAARDVGALHTRLVPGFVRHTEMIEGAEPPTRVVTFVDGRVLTEAIVSVGDDERRLVWAIQGEPARHHNGALQVIPEPGGGCRAVWTADVLPDALAEAFGPLMQRGLAAMKQTLEAAAATRPEPPTGS